MSLNLARHHTCVEIDCEIFTKVILFLPLVQEGLLSVTSRVYEHWLTPLPKLFQEKKCGFTDHLNMTIAVDWDVKPQTKQHTTNISQIKRMLWVLKGNVSVRRFF